MSLELGNLFEDATNTRFLNLVKDNESVKMEIDNLFDVSKFNELLAVTYVSSSSFFLRIVNKFDKAQLIKGIDDSDVLNRFKEGIDKICKPEESIKFWESLDEESKEKIRSNRLSIRYGNMGLVIHSKFYLLKGEDHTRVIIGSANLTKTAFSDKDQFEELMIFDNSPLYDLYLQRYQEILANTLDYIPERLSKASSDQLLLVTDPNLLNDILLENVAHKKIVISENVMEQLKNKPQELASEAREGEDLVQMIELITKKQVQGKGRAILSLIELKSKVIQIKTVLSKINVKSDSIDTRQGLFYRDSDNTLLKQESNANASLETVSKRMNERQLIRDRLLNINQFIEAYRLFTTSNNPETLSRICEIILYAFMSPYLWRIRQHFVSETGRETSRQSIPPFMIVAGRAYSGKTTAIEYISILMGNPSKYMPYEHISGKNVIADFFKSSNLMPIYTDEINTNFFTSKLAYKGEQFIKEVTNSYDSKHPVLIGTTNASQFDVSHQIKRRIYYLGVNNAFDTKRKQEAEEYLSQIMGAADELLFADFSWRVAQSINNNENFYQPNDYLYLARKIFRDYYREAELPIPDWFPVGIFDDYKDRGRVIWKELYETRQKHFVQRRGNRLSVDISQFSTGDKDKQGKINYLPPDCVIEDSHVVVLNSKEFFNFIRVNPPMMDRIRRMINP